MRHKTCSIDKNYKILTSTKSFLELLDIPSLNVSVEQTKQLRMLAKGDSETHFDQNENLQRHSPQDDEEETDELLIQFVNQFAECNTEAQKETILENMDLLFRLKPSLNKRDSNGHNALQLAVEKGLYRCVDKLLRQFPEHSEESDDLLIQLINHYEKVNKLSEKVAILEIIDLLFKAGATLEKRDTNGYNALHLAVEKNLYECVYKMVNNFPEHINDTVILNNENPKVELDDTGNFYFFTRQEATALDLAIISNNEEIFTLVASKGGKAFRFEPKNERVAKFEKDVKEANLAYLRSDSFSRKKHKKHTCWDTKCGFVNISSDSRANITISRLYEDFKRNTRDERWQDYIDLKVGFDIFSNKSWSAQSAIDDFLNDEKKKILFLTGKAGAGKSSFTKATVSNCWKNLFLTHAECFLPVYIPFTSELLDSIEKNKNSILEAFFNSLNITKTELSYFIEYCKNQSIRLLVCLDGLDQLTKHQRDLIANQIQQYEGKVILTSRIDSVNNQNVINWDYLAKLADYDGSKFTELCLQDFDDEQISKFFCKFINNHFLDLQFLIKGAEFFFKAAPWGSLVRNPALLNLLVHKALSTKLISTIGMQLMSGRHIPKEEKNKLNKSLLAQIIKEWILIQADKIRKQPIWEQILASAIDNQLDNKSQDSMVENCLMRYQRNLARLFNRMSKKNKDVYLSDKETLDPRLLRSDFGEADLLQECPLSLLKAFRNATPLIQTKNGYRFIDNCWVEGLINNPGRNAIIQATKRSGFLAFDDQTEKDSNELKIDYENWAVSLLRDPFSNCPNHVFIIVEGLNSWGDRVVNRFEVVFVNNSNFIIQRLWNQEIGVKISKNKCTPSEYYSHLIDILHQTPWQLAGTLPITIKRERQKSSLVL